MKTCMRLPTLCHGHTASDKNTPWGAVPSHWQAASVPALSVPLPWRKHECRRSHALAVPNATWACWSELAARADVGVCVIECVFSIFASSLDDASWRCIVTHHTSDDVSCIVTHHDSYHSWRSPQLVLKSLPISSSTLSYVYKYLCDVQDTITCFGAAAACTDPFDLEPDAMSSSSLPSVCLICSGCHIHTYIKHAYIHDNRHVHVYGCISMALGYLTNNPSPYRYGGFYK